ncbi:ABC transporter permease [Paenibacillus sp. IHB B 3415]|uniref:ABC transporter permease n=1 Tax=Paenibacillus sp. IHB B 3415 TaxID=867080 RepID=UPI00057330C3|nr:ABC transporter permease [Paenibacillus sp. IHB B 3415]KHL97135.1 ABC transporter permease [Paenibacillus sp. IHB B 3415]
MKTFSAELSKLISLPTIWVALAVGILVSPVVAAINSFSALSSISRGIETAVEADIGYQELAFGVMGAIILGVVAISSEYFTESEESAGGRQITTSLTAVPSRLRFLLSKATVVASASALLAIVTTAATMTVIQIILGEHAPALGIPAIPRLIGVVCYWILTALLAFGVTVLTRNGVIPLAILIMNTSVVTVTYLLTKITPLANYLPDMAGIRMFVKIKDTGVGIDPLWAGVIMTAWVAAFLTAAVIAFCRRDV